MFRQGDILFVPAPNPGKLGKHHRDRLVVAEGEITGHKHEVKAKDIFDTMFGTTRVIHLPTEAQVVHPDHDTITLPAGSYEVRQQRQYDSALEVIRERAVWD